jgi:hypothetical protein
MMPEDEDGELPEDSDIDDPDEWRDRPISIFLTNL